MKVFYSFSLLLQSVMNRQDCHILQYASKHTLWCTSGMKANNYFCKKQTKPNQKILHVQKQKSLQAREKIKITREKSKKTQGKLWILSHNGFSFVPFLPKKEKSNSLLNNIFTFGGGRGGVGREEGYK